jgi:hypothetical protein
MLIESVKSQQVSATMVTEVGVAPPAGPVRVFTLVAGLVLGSKIQAQLSTVQVMVEPAAGATPSVPVCGDPGHVGRRMPVIQSAGGVICSVCEQVLAQPFASVTVRPRVTVPVVEGMEMFTVWELPPTGDEPPPLYATVQA